MVNRDPTTNGNEPDHNPVCRHKRPSPQQGFPEQTQRAYNGGGRSMASDKGYPRIDGWNNGYAERRCIPKDNTES